MSDQQFMQQMNRLIETFGVQNYKSERIKLIYKLVQPFSVEWFANLVDEFIGSSERAPLLPKFEEAVSLERERKWRRERDEHERAAKDFMTGRVFSDEDTKSMVQTIVGRLTGDVNDDAWAAFQRVLNQYGDEGENKK